MQNQNTKSIQPIKYKNMAMTQMNQSAKHIVNEQFIDKEMNNVKLYRKHYSTPNNKNQNNAENNDIVYQEEFEYQPRFSQKVPQTTSPTITKQSPNTNQIQKPPTKNPLLNHNTIKCHLCQQKFTQSQIISFTNCSHTFCQQCGIHSIKQQIKKNKTIKCPLRGCETTLTNKNTILPYLTAKQLDYLHKIQNINDQPQINDEMIEYQDSIDSEDQHSSNVDDDIDNNLNNDDDGNFQSLKQSASNVRKLSKSAPNLEQPQKQIIHSKNGETVPKNNETLFQKQKTQNSSPTKTTNQLIKSPSKYTNESAQSIEQITPNKSSFLKKQSTNPLFSQLSKPPTPITRISTVPQKLFKKLHVKVWNGSWSKFCKILPISIIVLIAYILIIVVWLIALILYCTLIWLILIPLIWSLYQIWGCFKRSIPYRSLRLIIFVGSLILVPLILVFFYLLTMGLVVFYCFWVVDVNQLVQGKMSLVMGCRKVFLNGKFIRNNGNRRTCKCLIGEQCELCARRNSVLWLVF